MKRARWGVVAAAVLGAAFVPDAIGAESTTLTIEADKEAATLGGAAKSRDRNCTAGREIKLYWDEAGAPKDFEKIADTETAINGKWEIEAPSDTIPPGKYYAKVAKEGLCGGDKSKTIKVKAPNR